MAALQTLRDKLAVIITILIALALLAFILTDLFASGSIFTNSTTVGVIDGNSINIQDFDAEVRASEQFSEMSTGRSLTSDEQVQNRDNVWNNKVQEITFGNLYEKAGISVTGEELLDMVTGNHISPMLRQMFTNPETGIYDREGAATFLRRKNEAGQEQAAFFWNNIERMLKSQRLQAKYISLLSHSFYCNNAQKEVEKAKRANTLDVNFVNIRYALIPDSTIEVSDSEIKARYNKDKEQLYKVAESRDIRYISFPIRPTDLDRQDIQKELEALKVDFADPETNAVNFAQNNAENPTLARYMTAAQLNSQLADFVQSAQVGEVYGPYQEGNAYKISRLAEVANRPDSVKASHILVTEKELADSLFALAKGGADFAELARNNSRDNGSAINGGDLGWFIDGVMVPEFNEASFTNPKGSIVLVQSQYGYHIIKVTDRSAESKKYLIATIDKTIQYSSRTTQEVYAQAQLFSTNIHDEKTFDAITDTANIAVRVGRGIRSDAQSINAIRHARDIVKWAFTADLGEVSGIMNCDDEFVIAVLSKKQEKGYANVSDVSAGIARQIRNEKKAAQVATATQGKTLAQIAEQYDTKIDSAHNVNFSANSVVGAGVEPALIGKAFSLEQNKPFSAIQGNNGAYALEVMGSTENNASDEQVATAYYQQTRNLQYSLYQYVTDVEIEDNRIKFY